MWFSCRVVLLAASLASAFASHEEKRDKAPPTDVVYTFSNNGMANYIVALALDKSTGKLSAPATTQTGGRGQRGLISGPPFGKKGSLAGPDGLFSQDSLIVAGNYLFVVNSGSATLSMFIINPKSPLTPKLACNPISTGGDFPVSLTYSSTLSTVCVLNGGEDAGVMCFKCNDKGMTPSGPFRGLPRLVVANPPVGPYNTASDISFNPSSTAVLVTLKGTPGTPSSPGYIYAFHVKGDILGTTPMVSQLQNNTLDFSMTFLGTNDNALVTDPTFGASLITIASDYSVTEKKHIAVPGQGGASWTVYSSSRKQAYAFAAARTNITVIDSQSGDVKGGIGFDAAANGGFDAVLHQDKIYFLTGDNSIYTIALDQGTFGTQISTYSLKNAGGLGSFQGIATWPNSGDNNPAPS